MKLKRSVVVLFAMSAIVSAGIPEPINIEGGQVTGTPAIQWTPGVRLFRGIPYAAPPLGDLRWRSPRPVIPWKEVRRADHFSAACMQAPTDTTGNAWREGHVPVSEDCLYLNVWTPAQNASAKLPVMVFIHGGGNTRGAGSENQYDGAYLAKKGVVYVSLNYRMNIFGFLAHPDLTRESEHHSSGNYALLDQIAALQWVQRNIAQFGGDPGTVMIFGHSAGGANVNSLVASPLAKGLFHRALLLSGNSLNTRTKLADAEKAGAKLAEVMGATSIASLRQKPAAELLKAPRGLLGINVDGWVLPDDVYSIFAAGKQNDVPLIIGTVADDAPGPAVTMKADDVPAYAQNTFHEFANDYMKLYPVSSDAEAASSALSFRSNSGMSSARTLARLQSQTGKSKAYWYYFTHVSPIPADAVWGGRPAPSWGVYHGSELVYVFNAFPLQDWKWRPADLELGDKVSSIWVNFAKTGSPNGAGLPQWPPYDPKKDILMNFGDKPEAGPAPYRERLDFIARWATSQRAR